MRRFLGLLLLVLSATVNAFELNTKSNVVVYWGQDGGRLADICASRSVDVVVLGFLNTFFGSGGYPVINFASSCSGPAFPGTDLLQCPQIGQDILTCQSAGKIVLLSLGGAYGTYGFSSSDQAVAFATTLWNVFGGGSSYKRPFGNVTLDGFDLDIENFEPQYYSDFVNAMRQYYSSANKQYYISAAPQCIYPDESIGPALDASMFDMLFIQFFDNPSCNAGSDGFNFETWQNWATNSSPNKNVKLFVGVPGASNAALSGYVTPTTLDTIVSSTIQKPNFGGVMMWDANQALENFEGDVNYVQNAKNGLLMYAA